MKKTQAVSAAIFALSLGIVAPAANIFTPVDTYAIANDSVSSNINALIDEAMLTHIEDASATAYDYAALRDAVKDARGAIADQTQRLVDQLIIEDGTTAADYEGLSVDNLIWVARNRAGYEDASMTALREVVNNAENNLAWHKNQIRNNLFDKFGENVDGITTLDEAIVAAENTPKYDLFMELLDRIQEARDVDNSDATLKDAYEAMEAIVAAMGAINPAVIPVNPIDPIEPGDPIDTDEPTNSDQGNTSTDDNQTEGGLGSAVELEPVKVTSISTPNTGIVAAQSTKATAAHSLTLINALVAGCVGVFGLIVRAARRKN